MTAPGIPNNFALSSSCFGARLPGIADQIFAAVGMGFRRLELGRSDAPPAMEGLDDARAETGLELIGLVAGCRDVLGRDMPATQLASLDDDRRRRAINSVRRHARLAMEWQCPRVIVRGSQVEDVALQLEARRFEQEVAEHGLGPELMERLGPFVLRMQTAGQEQVQHLCRSLHEIMQSKPEVEFALEPGRALDDLLGIEAMSWVLDDLQRHRLGYWHDVGRIHQRERLGLPSHAEWLDRFASRMTGVHLQDAAEGETGMPLGLGTVDFKLLREALPKQAERVLDVHHRHGRAEILSSVQFLLDRGF